MRTVSRFLAILLFVSLVPGAEAARAYRLAHVVGELRHSEDAGYVDLCPEGGAAAALLSRADPDWQPGFNGKRVLSGHALGCSGILREELASSPTHDGVPLCAAQVQLQSHSLLSLRCLLTV